jgi:hypothetical protein
MMGGDVCTTGKKDITGILLLWTVAEHVDSHTGITRGKGLYGMTRSPVKLPVQKAHAGGHHDY